MTPFVRAWPAQRERLAQERQNSLWFWYRQTYQIPLQDPRLENLTEMDLEVEYLAWAAYHQIPQPSADDGVVDAWWEAVQRGESDESAESQAQFVEQWRQRHASSPALSDDWDIITQRGGDGYGRS